MVAATKGTKPSTVVINDDEDGDDVAGLQAETVSDTRPPNNSQRPAIGMPKNFVCIIMEDNEQIGPTGQTVSLNGQAYIIRPGEKVMVPPGVIEVLDNAMMDVPNVNPQTRQVVGWKKRLRFPYRVVQPDLAPAA